MTRWVWMLTVAVMTALAAAAAVPALAAPALRPVSLPRDHGAHAGFGVEWWYTAGNLRGSDGHPYFWFATAWAAPMGVVSRVNLLDLRAGQVVFAHAGVSGSAPAPGTQHIGAGSFTIARGAGGRWRATDSSQGERFSLTMTPRAPYVLHGRRGLITQGPGGRSAYYSQPRLAATGALALAGRTITLRGLGWLDHQWGNFVAHPEALRWNWFACQLDDGRDLMLYEFLDANDRPSGVQAGTLVGARGAVTHLRAFTVTPVGAPLHPAGAKASYPQRWRLGVPAARIALTLRSRTRNGFIANTLVPSFWEAPASITHGARGGCIVESSREV